MSLSEAKVHIHGRLRGLTRRRVAQLLQTAGAKFARQPAAATLLVLGHASALGTLADDGRLQLGFETGAEFISEQAFKRLLGLIPAATEEERTYPAGQLERGGSLSAQHLRALALYDVVSADDAYSYRDLVAARSVGRLLAAGARLGRVVAAALALQDRGLSLSGARLSESSWGEILRDIEGQPARLDGQLLLPIQGEDIDANQAFARAEAGEAAGDLASARRWYELAARLDPDDGVIPYNLGNVLDSLGEPAAAELAYRQALAREPDLADAWFNLGVLQDKLGRPEEALASYVQAASVEPTYGDALHNAAALLMRLERFAEALPLWEKLATMAAPDEAAEARRLGQLCRLKARAAS
jgi:tetratricopeptide (TPR) repeat protein